MVTFYEERERILPYNWSTIFSLLNEQIVKKTIGPAITRSSDYFISKPVRLKQLAYSIVDLRGNVISTGVIVNNVDKVEISELNDGIYFLQTEIGSIKLLKQ